MRDAEVEACPWSITGVSCKQCLSFSLSFKFSSFAGKVWTRCPGKLPVCDKGGVCKEEGFRVQCVPDQGRNWAMPQYLSHLWHKRS